MPKVQTKFFGELDYAAESLIRFGAGLPGFEDQRSFLLLTLPGQEPLMFLQSLSSRNLCFVLVPILVVDPQYRIELNPEELADLDLPADRQPVIGKDILCAALIASADCDVPTANLMAPVVVNLRTNTAMQVIHGESGYSHRHPLHFAETALAC